MHRASLPLKVQPLVSPLALQLRLFKRLFALLLPVVHVCTSPTLHVSHFNTLFACAEHRPQLVLHTCCPLPATALPATVAQAERRADLVNHFVAHRHCGWVAGTHPASSRALCGRRWCTRSDVRMNRHVLSDVQQHVSNQKQLVCATAKPCMRAAALGVQRSVGPPFPTAVTAAHLAAQPLQRDRASAVAMSQWQLPEM